MKKVQTKKLTEKEIENVTKYIINKASEIYMEDGRLIIDGMPDVFDLREVLEEAGELKGEDRIVKLIGEATEEDAPLKRYDVAVELRAYASVTASSPQEAIDTALPEANDFDYVASADDGKTVFIGSPNVHAS